MFVKRIRLSFASAGLMSCNYYQLVEMFYILLIGAMFHSSFFTHQLKKKMFHTSFFHCNMQEECIEISYLQSKVLSLM